MSRIRTVKPEFFKHESLFDAERESGLPLRLAFAGLWTCCDREGRFVWRPRALKTDILPYDDVDFSRVLDALAARGFVVKYASGGREYGVVPGFARHQVINNRESPSEIPAPEQVVDTSMELTRGPRVNDASPTRHGLAQGEGEGKGREEDSETNVSDGDAVDPAKAVFDAGVKVLCGSGIPERQARTFVGKLRKDHPDQDGQILGAIMDCGRAGAVDPIPWIPARLATRFTPQFDPAKFEGIQ